MIQQHNPELCCATAVRADAPGAARERYAAATKLHAISFYTNNKRRNLDKLYTKIKLKTSSIAWNLPGEAADDAGGSVPARKSGFCPSLHNVTFAHFTRLKLYFLGPGR